jgi:hypothetical protein
MKRLGAGGDDIEKDTVMWVSAPIALAIAVRQHEQMSERGRR